MKTPPGPAVSARKQPRQARSSRLVADILEAAIRVLVREGARRFTAARVAEAAGVSVGSLYQYFPNKEAILFQLQTDEWARTSAMLESMLGDTRRAPLERLRGTVHAFFRTEYDEAAYRIALDDAVPLYRNSPQACVHREVGLRQAVIFMGEALPEVAESRRVFAAEVVMTAVSTIGERISGEAASVEEVDAWADEVGDMVCAYVERLAENAEQRSQPCE